MVERMCCCEIYNSCFPQFRLSFDHFEKFLFREHTTLFTCVTDGKMIGFALVEEYALRLLCVLPEYQHQGYGTKLLREAESFLQQKHFERIITGGVSSELFIGAVSESWGFFEKNGYSALGQCDEMLMKLADFRYRPELFHGHDQATFGWYQGDMEALHRAVAAVDADWVQYFDDPDRVFVGMVNGEIASFCLVDLDVERYLMDTHGRIGMPGCVGTVPEYRNRGIALEMIAIVTDYLRQQGMDTSFIFFTGVAPWYAKLGYQTFLTEIFGEKRI